MKFFVKECLRDFQEKSNLFMTLLCWPFGGTLTEQTWIKNEHLKGAVQLCIALYPGKLFLFPSNSLLYTELHFYWFWVYRAHNLFTTIYLKPFAVIIIIEMAARFPKVLLRYLKCSLLEHPAEKGVCGKFWLKYLTS